jgi:tetratricopeptide (TPR) repeat protein
VTAAPTESPPALGVAPPLAPSRSSARHRLPAGATAGRPRGLWPGTLILAASLCVITFYAKGGLNLESMTRTEIALTIVAGLVLAMGAIAIRGGGPAHGLWPAVLLAAFAALSAISIVWSVQPDESWRDAERLLAYAAIFAATVVVVRLAGERWPAILGGIVVSSVVICGYVLVTKSLPNHFPRANGYARLYEPYGYWNALGLTAAMGAIGCMWLGSRRSGHALLSALAYPAIGVLLLTLLLAYSRGALVALGLGLVLWFCLVPLRLRGAAVLLLGGAAAGSIAAWDFKTSALSSEKVPLAEATSAGHELGALTIAMVVLLTLVGVGITFATGRRAPTPASRRRAGTALLCLLGLLILAGAGALAHSQRGFTGSISHAFNRLTDTHAKVPNTPGRLTAIASVRAQYWDEALKVFKAHPALGAGADGYDVARLRYLTGPLPAKHAHGFIVQTLADLGLVGLGLALALLGSWMAAAGRATHPFNRRWTSWRELRAAKRPAWRELEDRGLTRYSPERIGMLSMLCLVVVFGAHSLIDWTWYVPGNAIPALICAGWLAGRGPLFPARPGTGPGRPALQRLLGEGGPGSLRLGIAAAVILATLLVAYSQWQPQRAEEKSESALAMLEANPRGARSMVDAAVSADPLSVEALFALSHIQQTSGEQASARQTLARAVRLQPSNPKSWLELGRFDLASNPRAALNEFQAAVYLDPGSIAPESLANGRPEAIAIYNEYIQALRATTAARSGLKSAIGPPGTRAGGANH